jgi:histidine ammonia-lyase
MGSNAATKLVRVVDNCEEVLAIELFNAAQALEFRRPAKTSPILEKIFSEFRKEVPFVKNDEYLHPYIMKAKAFLSREDLFEL